MSMQGGWGGWGGLGGWGGWGSAGGWGGWSGAGGWGGPPATLADGFANPVTAAAMVLSREGTVQPSDYDSYVHPEPARDETALERWEPWVRASIASQTLLATTRVTATGNAAEVFAVNAGGQMKIATLLAPPVVAFRRQLRLVMNWAALREERGQEVLAQIDNQWAFFGAIPYIHPTRTPRTIELLGILMQMVVPLELRVKHALACWRPIEYSPQVQPMITTPGHGSLPSGHATQAYALAHVLRALLGTSVTKPDHPMGIQLLRLAARISTNRVVAGVHFPVDSIAGRMLGTVLGELFVARCGQGTCTERRFDGTKEFETKDVEFNPFRQPLTGGQLAPFYWAATMPSATDDDDLLKHLWGRAKDEWKTMYDAYPAKAP